MRRGTVKFAAGFLVWICAAEVLLALHAGDPAVELKADFVLNGPVELTGEPAVPEEARSKVLVFFRTREASSRALMELLADQKGRYPKVDFAAVTPDSKGAAQEFFKVYTRKDFSGASDRENASIKAYLNGSTVYPYAFLIGPDGMIRWDGEAADIAEILEKYSRNLVDTERNRKLVHLVADLRSRFRTGEERMAQFAAERIFAIDPAHGEAIRLRLFMLQNAGNERGAWRFMEERRKAAPRVPRLYLQQFVLACRSTAYNGEALNVVRAYRNNIPTHIEFDSAMAWQLLIHRPFDADALLLAGQLIGRSMQFLTKSAKVVHPEDGDLYMAAALYSYRLGRVEKAELLQKKATSILEQKAPLRVETSRRMEAFYHAVRNLTR